MKRSEPWYIHAGLIVVILVLLYFLIQVAIVVPKDKIAKEKYYTEESHRRMDNIRQAQILWEKEKDSFTDNLDSLIHFMKTNEFVKTMIDSVDTLTNREMDPFVELTEFEPFVNDSGDTLFPFQPDTLKYSPRTHSEYILQIDIDTTYDSIITQRGRLKGVDTTIVKGTRYYLECPDGYGTVGDLYSDALKNAASWE